MFGLSLPGFLNPLTPFKQVAAVVGTAVEDVKDLAATPVKMAQHQAAFAKDVLTLDFKGAAREQAAMTLEPLNTGKEIVGNHVGLAKKLVGNLF